MRWLRERWLAPVLDGLGDACAPNQREGVALELVLTWALSQLRPDRAEGLDGIDETAWIQRTSWRPMLAVACQFGLLSVPPFPTHYRRRPEESVVDNLCGLWSVGPSTFYRYLDKGKRLMADLLVEGPPTGSRLFGLRQVAGARLRQMPEPPAGWRAWHHAESEASSGRGAVGAALWHALQRGDDDGFIRTLQRFALSAANVGDCDVLVERVLSRPLSPRQQFDLLLARALVWRNRRSDERELEALNQALRLGHGQDDPLLIGIAFGALGKFHEAVLSHGTLPVKYLPELVK